jgi:hypothetical protein
MIFYQFVRKFLWLTRTWPYVFILVSMLRHIRRPLYADARRETQQRKQQRLDKIAEICYVSLLYFHQ